MNDVISSTLDNLEVFYMVIWKISFTTCSKSRILPEEWFRTCQEAVSYHASTATVTPTTSQEEKGVHDLVAYTQNPVGTHI